MKNIFNIIIFSLILWVGSTKISFAATGPADIYKVTMRKVELCTASTGVTSCENAVVIGSGDRTIDIAAVGEGAVAAAYGDPALLPLGTTYTHMRVTIDRKFSVRSKAAISGGDGNTDECVTIATTDVANSGTLVPIAITETDMTASEILSSLANFTAPSTKNSEPAYRDIEEIINQKSILNFETFGILKFSSFILASFVLREK